MTLNDKRRDAASGSADSLVIFLHGYGADGADLLGLAEPLAPALPNAMFAAPDAPQRSRANPFGFQWFPIPYIDGSSEAEAAAGLNTSVEALNAYLDAIAADTGIGPERTVVIGFSQGTMMSLHVLPRRKTAVAGIVGFSGRLLGPDRLAEEVTSRPPVLLVHGEADDVVPPSSLPEARAALEAAGFEVATHISKATAHSIAPDGLALALGFLKQKLA